jgi:predicted house-cleaning noncanonical NTP pyrophosphatase (MazG superfamily)
MAKLIRDKIPEIMAAQGKKAVTHVASESEYAEFLNKKLQEEVAEYLHDKKDEELADILEVLMALAESRGLSFDEIEKIRQKKAEGRGTFSKKLILDRTD